jgi:hypothetical protein
MWNPITDIQSAWMSTKTVYGKLAIASYYSFLALFLLACVEQLAVPVSNGWECIVPDGYGDETTSSSPAAPGTGVAITNNIIDAESMQHFQAWFIRIIYVNYLGIVAMCLMVGPQLYAIFLLVIVMALGVLSNVMLYHTLQDSAIRECFEAVFPYDAVFIVWPLVTLLAAGMEKRHEASVSSAARLGNYRPVQ